MISILMVCLGNICRSPLAQGIFESKVSKQLFKIDSAGTSATHSGEAPDIRSIAIAQQYGIDISNQQSRQIDLNDIESFDYIFVMDQSNYDDVIQLTTSDRQRAKVSKILDWAYPDQHLDIPDPYYGGKQGFKKVYQLLDQATDAVLQQLPQPDIT